MLSGSTQDPYFCFLPESELRDLCVNMGQLTAWLRVGNANQSKSRGNCSYQNVGYKSEDYLRRTNSEYPILSLRMEKTGGNTEYKRGRQRNCLENHLEKRRLADPHNSRLGSMTWSLLLGNFCT
jgi:hypothetical protein